MIAAALFIAFVAWIIAPIIVGLMRGKDVS